VEVLRGGFKTKRLKMPNPLKKGLGIFSHIIIDANGSEDLQSVFAEEHATSKRSNITHWLTFLKRITSATPSGSSIFAHSSGYKPGIPLGF
jgi:hypothetical protein